MKFGELSKTIANAWKALDDSQKKIFKDKYEEDKKRYDREMLTYKKPSTESEDSDDSSKKRRKKSTKKKDPNAPKQATNAYMYFQREQREKIKKENPNLKTLPQLAKKMGEIWSAMTDEDKKPYTELSGKDKKRYEEETKAYKLKQELEKKELEAKKGLNEQEDDDGSGDEESD